MMFFTATLMASALTLAQTPHREIVASRLLDATGEVICHEREFQEWVCRNDLDVDDVFNDAPIRIVGGFVHKKNLKEYRKLEAQFIRAAVAQLKASQSANLEQCVSAFQTRTSTESQTCQFNCVPGCELQRLVGARVELTGEDSRIEWLLHGGYVDTYIRTPLPGVAPATEAGLSARFIRECIRQQRERGPRAESKELEKIVGELEDITLGTPRERWLCPLHETD